MATLAEAEQIARLLDHQIEQLRRMHPYAAAGETEWALGWFPTVPTVASRVVFVTAETTLVFDRNGWHLPAAPPAWWLEMTDAGNDDLPDPEPPAMLAAA